jgi:hypothetical protein
LNGIYPLPNFMKIYQAVQKLLVGDTQTDRQTDWCFDKPTFVFGKYAKMYTFWHKNESLNE